LAAKTYFPGVPATNIQPEIETLGSGQLKGKDNSGCQKQPVNINVYGFCFRHRFE